MVSSSAAELPSGFQKHKIFHHTPFTKNSPWLTPVRTEVLFRTPRQTLKNGGTTRFELVLATGATTTSPIPCIAIFAMAIRSFRRCFAVFRPASEKIYFLYLFVPFLSHRGNGALWVSSLERMAGCCHSLRRITDFSTNYFWTSPAGADYVHSQKRSFSYSGIKLRVDSKPSHSVYECSSADTQSDCSAIRTAYAALARAKRLYDFLALFPFVLPSAGVDIRS
jgi:hypothetical protein